MYRNTPIYVCDVFLETVMWIKIIVEMHVHIHYFCVMKVGCIPKHNVLDYKPNLNNSTDKTI
jgi:hypothetical protein